MISKSRINDKDKSVKSIGSSYMSYHKYNPLKVSRNIDYRLNPSVEDIQFAEVAVGGSWFKIADRRIDPYVTTDDTFKDRIPRSTIKRFSARARSRMLQDIAKINQSLVNPSHTLFITLTAPGVGWRRISGKKWKQRLNNFLTQLRKKYGQDGLCGWWRQDFQMRGAPHWHLVTMNVPYIEHEWVAEKWNTICCKGLSKKHQIDHFNAGTEVQRAKHWGAIKEYFSKTMAYVAKEQEDLEITEYDKGIFDYIKTFGKFWGRIGVNVLKELTTIVLIKLDCVQHFHRLQRLMKNYILGCKKGKQRRLIAKNKKLPPALQPSNLKKMSNAFSKKKCKNFQIMVTNDVVDKMLNFVGEYEIAWDDHKNEFVQKDQIDFAVAA